MLGSFEAGGLKGQHSKRINPNVVVNGCFTIPVVWGLDTGSLMRTSDSQHSASEAKSVTSKCIPVPWSVKQGAQEPVPPRGRGFTLSTSFQAHGTSCVRAAAKAAWIFPAFTSAPCRKCYIQVQRYGYTNKQHKQHTVPCRIDPAVWTPLSVSLSVTTGARIAGTKFQLNVIILVIIKHMSHYLQTRDSLNRGDTGGHQFLSRLRFWLRRCAQVYLFVRSRLTFG